MTITYKFHGIRDMKSTMERKKSIDLFNDSNDKDRYPNVTLCKSIGRETVDFNVDGWLDIAATNTTEAYIAVLIGGYIGYPVKIKMIY
jgi:hypothetical protein